MLSKEDNELVTNTDKGTPMGELFRRFWLPVALSEELPGPDCVPVKLKIMNEDLIAFRDTDGKVGLVDAYCPHRGAPMFFAPQRGVRPALRLPRLEVRRRRASASTCRTRPKATRSRTRCGSSPTPAAKPAAWSSPTWDRRRSSRRSLTSTSRSVPAQNIYVTKFQLECNWLQATEGDFDPSHGRSCTARWTTTPATRSSSSRAPPTSSPGGPAQPAGGSPWTRGRALPVRGRQPPLQEGRLRRARTTSSRTSTAPCTPSQRVHAPGRPRAGAT